MEAGQRTMRCVRTPSEHRELPTSLGTCRLLDDGGPTAGNFGYSLSAESGVREREGMPVVETAVRDLERIQMSLVRLHALLAQQPMSTSDRHRVDGYFDAFASNLVGLEEFLRGLHSQAS